MIIKIAQLADPRHLRRHHADAPPARRPTQPSGRPRRQTSKQRPIAARLNQRPGVPKAVAAGPADRVGRRASRHGSTSRPRPGEPRRAPATAAAPRPRPPGAVDNRVPGHQLARDPGAVHPQPPAATAGAPDCPLSRCPAASPRHTSRTAKPARSAPAAFRRAWGRCIARRHAPGNCRLPLRWRG
jgi:hypothetical protein